MKRSIWAVWGATVLLGVAPVARAGQLGPAQNYNVFILGNDTQSNVDSEGTVAVGGAATFSNYSAASLQPTNTPDALVVGGDLSFTNGTVNGDVHVGGTATLSGVTVTGTQSQDMPINFATAASELVSQSTFLNSLTANGTVGSGSLGLTLTGTDPNLNIFQLTAAQFATANNNGLNIVAPNGSTVVIDVAGTSPSLSNFQMYVNGSSSETNSEINNILFNFSGATSLTDTNVTIFGSVLAPSAALSFGYDHVDGTLIGASLNGNVEAHDYPFTGNLPTAVPEPSSFALFAAGSLAVVVIVARWRSADGKPAFVTRGRSELTRKRREYERINNRVASPLTTVFAKAVTAVITSSQSITVPYRCRNARLPHPPMIRPFPTFVPVSIS